MYLCPYGNCPSIWTFYITLVSGKQHYDCVHAEWPQYSSIENRDREKYYILKKEFL